MTARSGRSLFLVGLTSLCGCVDVQPGTPALVVSVRTEANNCRATVDGKRVTTEELLGIARGDPRRRGIVLYDKDTPYKCVGATIITLQHAGLMFVEAAMWDDR